jgi:hypothetical protein
MCMLGQGPDGFSANERSRAGVDSGGILPFGTVAAEAWLGLQMSRRAQALGHISGTNPELV